MSSKARFRMSSLVRISIGDEGLSFQLMLPSTCKPQSQTCSPKPGKLVGYDPKTIWYNGITLKKVDFWMPGKGLPNVLS